MQHYQARGLEERQRLTIDFYMVKMELGEHSRKFLVHVDQKAKELERVDRLVDPKDIDSGNSHARELVGLAHTGMDQACCDKPVSGWNVRNLPPRAERCCPPVAIAATMNPPSDALFAPAQDTLPCNAANSRSPAVRRSQTDITMMGNMTATVEARKWRRRRKWRQRGRELWRRRQ